MLERLEHQSSLVHQMGCLCSTGGIRRVSHPRGRNYWYSRRYIFACSTSKTGVLTFDHLSVESLPPVIERLEATIHSMMGYVTAENALTITGLSGMLISSLMNMSTPTAGYVLVGVMSV